MPGTCFRKIKTAAQAYSKSGYGEALLLPEPAFEKRCKSVHRGVDRRAAVSDGEFRGFWLVSGSTGAAEESVALERGDGFNQTDL